MLYSIEDHICQYCCGRVLSTVLEDGKTQFVCADCKSSVVSNKVSDLCMCGFTPKGKRRINLYRCKHNKQVTPLNRAEIFAEFVGGKSKGMIDG